MSESHMVGLSVADRVIDTEDDDPNVGSGGKTTDTDDNGFGVFDFTYPN
ncbi:hypothetical protein ACFFQF_18080 [Haladaptatus pallidirubidus]|uniref:Uncharacterized protein n=1 Tax=Haladaptatus pallidirubidus TaxID=1008152 RepID=A0AAV3UQV0_9EURY|nr:hypothetical protein [Haladaptatus pallidirubidus]